ncbi:MAG: IS21 family transposase [Candidatus Pacearchaeota archaeon]|nr:IS21 family transposase [Candidatus Pacearchaeota archaeon]
MNKLREIIRIYCKNKEFSERQLSRAVNVSRPVVHQTIIDFKKTGLSYTDIDKLSDDELTALLEKRKINNSQKYNNLSGRFQFMAKELKRVGVTRQLLWEEYRSEYSNGYSYSQFNYHFQVWQNSSYLTTHMDHKAGDKMFVDFAGKKMAIYDRKTGAREEVETFVAILGCSQLTYVEALMSQKKHDFIPATENAFIYFNGSTNAVVPDCLKSAVTKADKYEPDINPEYNDLARHYDTVILPARSRHPKDKAFVENAVRLVYWWIYAPLRNRKFYSLRELNCAIMEQLAVFNSKKMQKFDLSRLELFEQTEKDYLKPLPVSTYEFKTFKHLKVQFNYHVFLSEDKHYYRVPYHYRGKEVDLIYTRDNVEVFFKHKRIALHKREFIKGKYTTIAEHMPQHHRWVSKWIPERFINWGGKIGKDVKELVERILSNALHPEQAYKICLGILNLNKKYSNERINNACIRALRFEYLSYKGVKNILENNLDSNEEEADLFSGCLPEHKNIRGNNYYNKELIN